jgi:hypothetical protein
VIWRPPLLWMAAIAVFAASALYFMNRRPALARVMALGSCALAGTFAIQVQRSGSVPTWLGDEQEVIVTAHVTEEGNLEEDSPGSWRQRIKVKTEQISSPTRTENVRAGVRLNIYSKSSSRYYPGAAPDIAWEVPQKFAGRFPALGCFITASGCASRRS